MPNGQKPAKGLEVHGSHQDKASAPLTTPLRSASRGQPTANSHRGSAYAYARDPFFYRLGRERKIVRRGLADAVDVVGFLDQQRLAKSVRWAAPADCLHPHWPAQ